MYSKYNFCILLKNSIINDINRFADRNEIIQT